MVCVSIYSTLLTLNVRAFTLICLNFSINFSIKSYFLYFTRSLLQNTHIFHLLFYLNTHINSFFFNILSQVSLTHFPLSPFMYLFSPLNLLLSPLRYVPSHVLLLTIRSLFSLLSTFNFLYPLRSLLS